MAEEWIEKTVLHTDRKTKEKKKEIVRYRVDAEFVPSSSVDVCHEFIENYCVANNEIKWLLDTVSKTITNKNGETRPYPFPKVRGEFMEKFFPDTAASSGKSESWIETLKKKYGKGK